MAAELMLINPRRRKRRTAVRRNPRRKMSALQRKYFGGGGKRRRRGSSAARRAGGSPSAITVQTNPRRRRRRHIVRARRNPMRSRNSSMSITSALLPAAIGAGGAVAINYAFTNFIAPSMPASFQSGIGGSIAQIGIALAGGFAAGAIFGKKVGAEIAAGALTVSIFNMINTQMGSGASGGLLSAGNYGSGGGSYDASTLAGLNGPRMRRRRMMGRYVGNLNGLAGPQMRRRGMGYVGPARIAGPMPNRSGVPGLGRYLGH